MRCGLDGPAVLARVLREIALQVRHGPLTLRRQRLWLEAFH